uniref:Uncharacterized protein n=1 Tax=Rhizophora mucronata TaxID=61149 RepID=A0A2P2PTY8_RHIMU
MSDVFIYHIGWLIRDLLKNCTSINQATLVCYLMFSELPA